MTVVWDFGGVLLHWDPAALIARTLPHRITNELGPQHWKEQFFLSYRGEWGEYDRGAMTEAEMVPLIAKRTGLQVREVQAVIDAVPAELQPIEQSVALVRALRDRGHRLHYLSNMPGPLADRIEREQPFLQLFESGVFSSRVKVSKPAAAIFTLAEQAFGCDPATTLFVDDHPENIEAALAHGWQARLFTGADAIAAELRQLGLID